MKKSNIKKLNSLCTSDAEVESMLKCPLFGDSSNSPNIVVFVFSNKLDEVLLL